MEARIRNGLSINLRLVALTKFKSKIMGTSLAGEVAGDPLGLEPSPEDTISGVVSCRPSARSRSTIEKYHCPQALRGIPGTDNKTTLISEFCY